MSTAAPTIGVLALQGDVREHLQVLSRLGAATRAVRRPSELDGLQGLVIPGGESTTMCRLLDVFEIRDPLVERLRAGLPAFGSCAGMITLAETILDGRQGQRPLGVLDITVRRNAFGRQVDSFETELPIEGLPGGPLHTVFIRAPWAERTGAAVRVLASVGLDGSGTVLPADDPRAVATRAVAVRQGAILATSFHPEVTADDRVHGLFLDLVRAAG